MKQTAAQTTARTALRRVVVSLAVAAVMTGTLALQSSPSAPPLSEGLRSTTEQRGTSSDHGATTTAENDGAVAEDGGVLPDGVTAFDEEYPGVANLHPDLLWALRDAARDAADDGVTLFVNSGWRSPEYQSQLLREAVAEYGSEEEAARWVATPNTSAHVTGDAVDIGPFDAMAWLAEHGSEYGLCQIYSNEPWHYELRPEAIGRRCPPSYPDPTHNLRMHP